MSVYTWRVFAARLNRYSRDAGAIQSQIVYLYTQERVFAVVGSRCKGNTVSMQTRYIVDANLKEPRLRRYKKNTILSYACWQAQDKPLESRCNRAFAYPCQKSPCVSAQIVHL